MVVEVLSAEIRQKATELGFSHIGFASARVLEEEHTHLSAWLAQGYHAGMTWMERDSAKRSDPRKVLEGAVSVISVAMNYFHPDRHSDEKDDGKISRYAWGNDYHDVFDKRLRELEAFLVELIPESSSRRYVDTGPVMDKAWAVHAGIGWLGKHGNVITRDTGSWIFLGEILTTAQLEYDSAIPDYCGTCTACLEACPTQAIVSPYVVDSNRCISYLTIEHRGEHSPDIEHMNFDNWVFGCDTCQDVCPWNSAAVTSEIEAYAVRPGNLMPKLTDLAGMEDERFREQFRKSPVKRTKAEGLRRNARTVLRQQESYTDR